MLGYLSLEGGRGDVDGLREDLANEHEGRRYPVHHLGTTVIAEDPDHSASSVDSQISGGKMDGFVASYAATLLSRGVEGGDPAPIMGYYRAADVPVFDHLASEFAVCDRWFSSVPGRPGRTACTPCVPRGWQPRLPSPQLAAVVQPALVCPSPRRAWHLLALVFQRRWHLADG
jgi:hypothetical protein